MKKSFSPVVLFGLVALAGLVTACDHGTPTLLPYETEGDPSERPTKKRSGSEDAPDDEDAANGTPATGSEDDRRSPEDTAWSGTLAATRWIVFGGEPHCRYRARFTDVTITVKLKGDGKIVSAKLTGTAIEEALDGCPHSAIAPNAHVYTHASSGVTEPVIASPAATNQPRAELDVELVTTGPTASTAKVRWHRNDVGSPFDWTLTDQVVLTKL
jgi:hypothetical protein